MLLRIWCIFITSFIPDTVSSSEDPLLRDESSSTGVPPLPISVVLQGNLTETKAFNDYKFVYFKNSMMSHFAIVPAWIILTRTRLSAAALT